MTLSITFLSSGFDENVGGPASRADTFEPSPPERSVIQAQ